MLGPEVVPEMRGAPFLLAQVDLALGLQALQATQRAFGVVLGGIALLEVRGDL